jgi:hypothetical protein
MNNKINKLYNNLDNCIDKHCKNITTKNKLKEEELKFFKKVNEKCS